MSEKPKPKRDDTEQAERFIKAAREVEADETEEGARKAFKKVIERREAKPIRRP
jgi:hypothetical protein